MVDTPQTSPRGTDRVRRRAAQQVNKDKAQAEIKELTSPDTPEKAAAIEAKNAKIAKFGATPGGVRKAKQAEHRAAAEREIATLATLPGKPPSLVEGAQVDLRTANRMAELNDASARDFANEAAREAGLAVRATLRGKPLRDRHNRSRHIAEHNRRVELAAAQQK